MGPLAEGPQKPADGRKSAGHGTKPAAVRERAILALLAAKSLREAAELSGVGERTIRRWMRDDTFKAALADARREVKLSALERLAAYQDRAIDRLFTLVEQTDYPSTAMTAVRDVLDRTMGKPVEKVDMTVSGEVSVVTARLQAARLRLAKVAA
jgi:hypothetical protein